MLFGKLQVVRAGLVQEQEQARVVFRQLYLICLIGDIQCLIFLTTQRQEQRKQQRKVS
jgi:hypothetical protein